MFSTQPILSVFSFCRVTKTVCYRETLCLPYNHINRKENQMDFDKIMSMLQRKTEPQLVRFVSDKGPNSCKACLEHHGKIFRADAADKPQLPIHPNCRCKYEEVKESDAKTQSSGTNNSKIRQFFATSSGGCAKRFRNEISGNRNRRNHRRSESCINSCN